jgi:hypothetical protein
MALFYTIRIHAIPLTDASGTRACTVTASAFAAAIETVNEIFEPAAVRFAFDPARDWHPRRDTSLNSLHNGGSNWWVEANQVAAGNRGQFTVFLRWGKDMDAPAGNWFAYPPDIGQQQPPRAKLPHSNIDFIAITNQASKFGSKAAFVLAHEIGHYLGLFHTHPTWGAPDSALVESLVKESGANGLNGDLLSDTAPDPGTTYYKQKVSTDLCGGPASFKIGGITFTPDRHNVMSYYHSCQPPVSITPQQVQVVRATIQHPSRRHLIEASAGIRYAGVFRAGTDGHALWVGDDWNGFQEKWKELSQKGLRLIDLETYKIGNTRRYTGVFRAGNGGHALWVGDDWDGFRQKWQELSGQGLRLIDLETYDGGSGRHYAGVFREGNGKHALWVGDDWAGFEQKWKELSADGLRLIDIETWEQNGSRRFAGVFAQGNGRHALWVGDDWNGFEQKWQELSANGLRLIDFETWLDGRVRRYAGVFEEGSDKHALWVNDDWFGFQKKWEELSGKGLRLVHIAVFGSSVEE